MRLTRFLPSAVRHSSPSGKLFTLIKKSFKKSSPGASYCRTRKQVVDLTPSPPLQFGNQIFLLKYYTGFINPSAANHPLFSKKKLLSESLYHSRCLKSIRAGHKFSCKQSWTVK